MKLIRQGALHTVLILGVLLPASAVWSAGLPHSFTAGSPANAEDVNENFRYVAPENIVHVNPVPGGSATDNGLALLDAVDPATLSAINGAPTGTKPYLIKLAPGSYDTGTSPVTLSSFVYLEGSGKGTSWVRSTVSSATSGTIVAANNSAIRHLSVQNYESSGTGIAIYADNVTTLVEQVEVVIAGATVKAGLVADNGAELIANNVRVRGFPTGGNLYGVVAYAGSTLKLNNSVVEVTGSSTENMAADIVDSTAILHDVQLVVNNSNTSSGDAIGVRAYNNSTVRIQNARLDVKGGFNHYPLSVASTSTDVTVQHSDLLSGSGAVSDYFLRITGGSVKVATSRLAANYYLTSGGTVTCAYIYDTEFDEAALCNSSPI